MISPKSETHSSQRLKRKHLIQLEFQNKELEQFIYAASHDLKEPLRKIKYFNDYVLKYNEQNLDSNSKDYLKRSIVAAGRMSNLIDNLLGYSKINSKVDAYEQIHLKEVLLEIIVQHKEEIERTNATIDISNLPVITGVTFQIKQLLSNLINNSFKYKHPERDLKIIVLGELVDQTIQKPLS